LGIFEDTPLKTISTGKSSQELVIGIVIFGEPSKRTKLRPCRVLFFIYYILFIYVCLVQEFLLVEAG